MIEQKRILVVDDDELIRKSLYEVLKLEGYDVDTALNGENAMQLLDRDGFDVIIADLKMPKMDGMAILEEVRKRNTDTEVIVATGYGSIENAVECMRHGAYDYITKPIVDDEIKTTIRNALTKHDLMRENVSLKAEIKTLQNRFCDIVGRHEKMQSIYKMVKSISGTRATVLLRGESGTGKRMVAHAIHMSDPKRADKPFVEVSCGALPREILESELFGHVKGSFTSAINNRVGRFEMAQGGTILLDEIDTFAPDLQVKLLRFLQHREFEKVGDSQSIQVDVKVIAATNVDLQEEIRKGKFREDLYYRLNVIAIDIPPLRERGDDSLLLAEHFLKKFCKEMDRNIVGFTREALKRISEYNWPGNVRELENAIERATILTQGDVITEEDLPDTLRRAGEDAVFTPTGELSLKDALKDPERKIILDALRRAGGNRKKAAVLLQINRTTLYNKMKELGLEKDLESPAHSGF
ncbi:MAG: sigma-54-dependent Fis family transcriptional regulator [Candidatus Omnitrophica bacterium]|nr:sigma-54-dependent Fis family transcriptional regulator [Candidatus Omnitrophota bacterium]